MKEKTELKELSINELREIDKKLYNIIKKDYNYDLVIFIAKGSYLIGKDLSILNNTPLIEIFATRKGGKIKKIIRPLLKILPRNIKLILRKKEYNSNYHEKNSNRKIKYDSRIWDKYKNVKNILLVDDSVDTGYSIKLSKDVIETFFENSKVKVAALNCFSKSKKIVTIDYFLYEDTMLLGPWSNDSKENELYVNEYINWHKNQIGE